MAGGQQLLQRREERRMSEGWEPRGHYSVFPRWPKPECVNQLPPHGGSNDCEANNCTDEDWRSLREHQTKAAALHTVPRRSALVALVSLHCSGHKPSGMKASTQGLLESTTKASFSRAKGRIRVVAGIARLNAGRCVLLLSFEPADFPSSVRMLLRISRIRSRAHPP